MPCRGPTDSELYREASADLLREKGVHQETEEALCESNTLLIAILNDSKNSITLSQKQSQQVEKIKEKHLEHRVEELDLLLDTLKLDLDIANFDLEDLVKFRVKQKSEGFDANNTHLEKEQAKREDISRLQERVIELTNILELVAQDDSEMIGKVLTKTQ